MSMYIYIHVYIYILTCFGLYVCMYAQKYTHYAHKYIEMNEFMYVHMYVCVYMLYGYKIYYKCTTMPFIFSSLDLYYAFIIL